MSFEQDMKRLEEITKELRSNETALERSIELFEEGVRLTKELDGQLSTAERKIEILLTEADSQEDCVEVADFDTEESF